jgi:hypothetical protein
LYWRSDEKTRNLLHKPFETEGAFEAYIFEHQELLGDVFILHRQVRTGSREGIPDMLGVDQDARVCIIEMKNEEVREEILPQVLGYAIWAETNPDSIKAIWLESDRKPEDIEIEWDSMEIRVIVVAPAFRTTVPRMSGKIGYPIDLITVRRFVLENDEFLLVETIEEEPQAKVGTTKVKQEWDWEFYESEHGKKSTEQFRRAVDELEGIVQNEGWELPYNLNKYYVGFKLGNRVVFDVAWGGTHAWKIEMKVPRSTAEQFEIDGWEFQRYDEDFHNAIFKPKEPKTASVGELQPLLEAAYKNISGE